MAGSSRQATLTDTITFKNGTFKSEGADTLSTSSALQIYDGDGTPNLLWDFRNNGDIVQNGNSSINTGNNTLTIDGSNATTSNRKIFVINKPSGEALSLDEDGDLLINGSIKYFLFV